MRHRVVGFASVVLACWVLLTAASTRSLHAQFQAPSEQLLVRAASASVWEHGAQDILTLQGPVTIELDRATLSARRAVIWLTPVGEGAHATQRAEIALLDDAKVEQKVATRSGARLFVTSDVSGRIRLTTDERVERDDSNSALYRAADELRRASTAPPAETQPVEPPPAVVAPAPGTQPATQPAEPPPAIAATEPSSPPRESLPQTRPAPLPYVEQTPAFTPRNGVVAPGGAATRPTTAPAPQPAPVLFESRQFETVDAGDGTVAAVLSGGVTLMQRRPNGDTIELRSERAVLFTTLQSLHDLQKSERVRRLQDTIRGAYLEGDVRITLTPVNPKMGEQRLAANRVYYEFATDRAVLTDAVIHTLDPIRQVPMIMRAKTVRQLAVGEYTANKAQLTTSYFAVPSYAINADRIYVRADEVAGPIGGERIYFQSTNTTFRTFGVPVFWWPSISGSLTDNGEPLRDIGVGNRNGFGSEAMTEWGLFESLGVPPPRDLDLAYRLDYFTERGPGFGLNGAYGGGLLTDYSRQPWDFKGDFKSYLVLDKGEDKFNDFRAPTRLNEGETLRGRVAWEHQHFFPDDWQLQLRAGYVSDATFREEWFRREWEQDLPLETSAYVKHQQQTEAFTLLVSTELSHVVTTADLAQEQFEVEKLPEIGYRRIGDSLLDDHVTTFSDNTFAGLHFQRSRSSLFDQGYRPPGLTPGLPSLGLTGTTGKTVYRANFREEVDYPITAGAFRIVPYAMGIYTEYSDSPDSAGGGGGGAKARILVGGGAKITTEFWKVDPNAHSDIFDIHQLRHVIEPELNLFTAVQNINQKDVFIYEEPIDAVNDISAASFAVHQRWQTKRGGPGQWRSVDFLSFNAEIDGFLNKPPPRFLNPRNFRGLYFPSLPETSVPRDAINADMSWRLSDTTVVISDMSYNLDKKELATAAVGILVQRGDHVSYYIENRYVDLLQSNITTLHLDYELSSKYLISLNQSFDFSFGKNVNSSIAIARRFDTFIMSVAIYRDDATGENGFNFNIAPLGLRGGGAGTSALQGAFNR